MATATTKGDAFPLRLTAAKPITSASASGDSAGKTARKVRSVFLVHPCKYRLLEEYILKHLMLSIQLFMKCFCRNLGSYNVITQVQNIGGTNEGTNMVG